MVVFSIIGIIALVIAATHSTKAAWVFLICAVGIVVAAFILLLLLEPSGDFYSQKSLAETLMVYIAAPIVIVFMLVLTVIFFKRSD